MEKEHWLLRALAEKGEHLLQDAGSCEILHAVQPCKHSQPMAVRPSVIIIQQVQTQILQYICILWAEIRNEYKDYFFFSTGTLFFTILQQRDRREGHRANEFRPV